MKRAVLISCFDWYKARLKTVRELLIEQGYDVLILEADFDHIKKIPISIRYSECTYIHVPPYKGNISYGRIRSHLSFGKQVADFICELKPELLYCQVPPNNTANECRKYKIRNPETKLIVDIIDLWPESMPLERIKRTPPINVWRNWRDDAIKVADHVFTECDLYKEKLKSVLDPSKTSTLHLYKEQTEEERKLVEEIIRRGKTDDVVRFAYLGSMNNIIDIEGICEVIQRTIEQGKTCELHAIGDGESREKFEGAVKATGCQTHFYGPVFDELEKIRILTPCDYAFNMMKGDIAVGLTIKSIDYLSYDLPLINNIRGDTWSYINSYNIGNNIDDKSFIEICSINRHNIHSFFLEYLSKAVFVDGVEKAFNMIKV